MSIISNWQALMGGLKETRPDLLNRNGVFLHHKNGRSYTPFQTRKKYWSLDGKWCKWFQSLQKKWTASFNLHVNLEVLSALYLTAYKKPKLYSMDNVRWKKINYFTWSYWGEHTKGCELCTINFVSLIGTNSFTPMSKGFCYWEAFTWLITR